MEKPRRAYRGTDSEMLTACDVLMNHAIESKEFLVSKRANWGGSFFDDVRARIQRGLTDFLGVNSVNALSESTQKLLLLQEDVMGELADVKVQIEVDFKKDATRRDQILNVLGYSGLYKEVQRHSQQSLVELLFKFKQALTPELKTELTAKGIDGASLDKISSYADLLHSANVTQEGAKSTRKEITAEAITELNAIYEEVIGIALIAAAFYRGDKVKQEYFSYTRALRNLTSTPQKAAVPSSTDTPKA